MIASKLENCSVCYQAYIDHFIKVNIQVLYLFTALRLHIGRNRTEHYSYFFIKRQFSFKTVLKTAQSGYVKYCTLYSESTWLFPNLQLITHPCTPLHFSNTHVRCSTKLQFCKNRTCLFAWLISRNPAAAIKYKKRWLFSHEREYLFCTPTSSFYSLLCIPSCFSKSSL